MSANGLDVTITAAVDRFAAAMKRASVELDDIRRAFVKFPAPTMRPEGHDWYGDQWYATEASS